MNHGAAADIVIIGGGVMGGATAAHLLREEPGLHVTIIEPDIAYTLAATPRASGGVRQLFSCPENIAMSQYTLDVIADWRGFAGADAPDLIQREIAADCRPGPKRQATISGWKRRTLILAERTRRKQQID